MTSHLLAVAITHISCYCYFLWPKDWCVLQDRYWFLAKVTAWLSVLPVLWWSNRCRKAAIGVMQIDVAKPLMGSYILWRATIIQCD